MLDVYGWWAWLDGGPRGDGLPVTAMSARLWAARIKAVIGHPAVDLLLTSEPAIRGSHPIRV